MKFLRSTIWILLVLIISIQVVGFLSNTYILPENEKSAYKEAIEKNNIDLQATSLSGLSFLQGLQKGDCFRPTYQLYGGGYDESIINMNNSNKFSTKIEDIVKSGSITKTVLKDLPTREVLDGFDLDGFNQAITYSIPRSINDSVKFGKKNEFNIQKLIKFERYIVFTGSTCQ